tara:strand:- start:9035 stop:9988 length:954 start_codon:yes stop_codon:yes gene_type:complete
MWLSGDDQNRVINMQEAGADWFLHRLEQLETWPLVDTWETLNETGPHPTHEYMKFELRLAELLHSHGKKIATQGCSVGTWAGKKDDPMYDWQSEWVRSVLRVSDYIILHEYGAPAMDDPRDAEGWLCFRYRRVWDELPDDCKKPLLISECGIDSGASHWNPGAQGGWQSFTTIEDYLRQLAWYEDGCKADGYIEALFPFCFGTADPTWDTYDLWEPEYAREAFKQYIIAQHGVAPGNFESNLSNHAQTVIIPYNSSTYFRRVAAERGWQEALSDEFDYGDGVKAQVFITKEGGMYVQKIIYAPIDQWARYKVITRRN